jgi:hypothetical protein
LKLAVVETKPGAFTAYARLLDVYEYEDDGKPLLDENRHSTICSVWHNLDSYAPDQHSALDALLVALAQEVNGPFTLEMARQRAAELIDEIEASRAN